MERPIRASEVRTGDRIKIDGLYRVITRVRSRFGQVTFEYRGGETTIAATAKVRIKRESRIENHDAPRKVYDSDDRPGRHRC